MRTSLFLSMGLLLCLSLSGVGLNANKSQLTDNDLKRINEEMNNRFMLRDTFKEKGNSGKYLKVHSNNWR
jgi:hypothetical protein